MREPCLTVQFLHALIGSIKKRVPAPPNTLSCIWFFRSFLCINQEFRNDKFFFFNLQDVVERIAVPLYRFLPSTLSFTAIKFFGDSTCAQASVVSVDRPISLWSLSIDS